jgi:hypothetical protein
MNVVKAIATLLLALWLILTGISPFLKIQIPQIDLLVPLLALTAGIFILISSEKPSGTIGLALLGIYLLLNGLIPFLKFKIPGGIIGVSLLAIVCGIFLLLKR